MSAVCTTQLMLPAFVGSPKALKVKLCGRMDMEHAPSACRGTTHTMVVAPPPVVLAPAPTIMF